MKATNIKEAWSIADSIISGDYLQDGLRSQRAGYDIYVSTNGSQEFICDLGSRLEVNKADGTSVNIWIEEEETNTDILGIPVKQTFENTFHIPLSNGKRIDIIKDPEHNGSLWAWKIDTQIFSKDEYAKGYLKELIAEKLTGLRIIHHKEKQIPDICGVNGACCRHPKECNTMLCSDCPIALQFFAERDNVTLVYMS